MLMKKCFLGLIRRPAITAVCVVILIFSLVLSVLGETMSAVSAPVQAPEADFVEIAVIIPQLWWKDPSDMSMLNTVKELYEDVAAGELFRQHTQMIDIRTFAGAHSSEIDPIWFTESAVGNCISWMHNQNFGIFVGKCTAVKVNESGALKSYQYQFDIEQTVHLHQDAEWDGSRQVTLSDTTFESSGPMAEEGKRYLFWGMYLKVGDTGYYVTTPINRTFSGQLKREEQNGMHVLKENGKSTGDFVPLISELRGSPEEFMQSEIGALWQRSVVERIAVCEHSLSLIGTDCLESVYTFNIREATVTEGQAFTAAQYESGERVCIISRELAQPNGLQVGDMLPLQVYRAAYVYGDPGAIANYNNIYDPYAGYGDEGEWRIVGIYAHDYEPGGEYDLHPNTVFVPNKSLAGDYSQDVSLQNSDFSLSFILKKGQAEAFRLEAEAAGYGGMFLYHDGGRAEEEARTLALQEQISAWQARVNERVKIIRLVSIALPMAAMLLFVLSKKREIGEFYAIETMRGTLFSHFLIQLAVILVASCMLGVMLGLLILPALTEARLLRLAGEELAEALVILLPKEITCELSMLSNRGILLGIVAFLCAMIAAVRKYQFVYDEKE